MTQARNEIIIRSAQDADRLISQIRSSAAHIRDWFAVQADPLQIRPFRQGRSGLPLPVIDLFAGCGVSIATPKQVSLVRKTHVQKKRSSRNPV